MADKLCLTCDEPIDRNPFAGAGEWYYTHRDGPVGHVAIRQPASMIGSGPHTMSCRSLDAITPGDHRKCACDCHMRISGGSQS